MKNYELTIEDGKVTFIDRFIEKNGKFDDVDGVLYIPKEVKELFATESIIGCYPEDIIVEEGNESYCAREHCLFTKDGRELLMISKKSVIPMDTKIIGASVFAPPVQPPEHMRPPVLPQNLEEIRYRGLATENEGPASVVIPITVKKIGLMGLMIHSPKVGINFIGDPELEIGVFGTKAEAMDLGEEYDTIYKELPDLMYIDPDTLHIYAHEGTGVIEYCKKYGIPYVEKKRHQ